MWHVWGTEDVHMGFWWGRSEGKRPLGRPSRRRCYGEYNGIYRQPSEYQPAAPKPWLQNRPTRSPEFVFEAEKAKTCLEIWITCHRVIFIYSQTTVRVFTRGTQAETVSTDTLSTSLALLSYSAFYVAHKQIYYDLTVAIWVKCRSQWPCGLRRRSSVARLLRSWVRIPPGAWMFVCCECCVLSGRGLCDGLITRPEESYRLWCVVV